MVDAPEPIQRFSTQNVAPAARFDYWADVVSRALLPLNVQAADVSSFEASVSQVNLGVLDIIRTQGSAHHSWRTRQDVERGEEPNSYHLLVSRGGPWAMAQRGQKYLPRGDLVLHDSKYAYRIDIESQYDIVNVKLPPAWLQTWVADPEALVGRQIVAASGWGQVLSRVVSSLLPEFAAAAPLPASVLSDHVGATLALVCGQFGSSLATDRRLAQQIVRRIRERCTECALTGTDIAESLSIELRVLHAALASIGSSFATELLGLRVALAAQLLRTPSLRRLKISDIARRAGFSDVAHFRRIVRAHLGVAPEAVRANALNGNNVIAWDMGPTFD
jgi:AraC family transcriptional activator of tynA and feaB